MCRIIFQRLVLYALLSCILFITLSCNDRKVSLPIDEAKLIDVLCDIHIIEGALQGRPQKDKDSIAELYYSQIYEKHDIAEQRFIQMLELMQEDPKMLESICGKVLIRLDTLEERSYKSKYKKKN